MREERVHGSDSSRSAGTPVPEALPVVTLVEASTPAFSPEGEKALLVHLAPARREQRGQLRRLGGGAMALARAGAWVVRTAFGVLSLFVLLALLAAIPVLQFLTLGYLLEVSGRIGRTGQLRSGFIGLDQARRVGGLLLAVGLVLLPLQLVASLAFSARLVDPGGAVARGWNLALLILTVLAGLHIAFSCARGGRLRYFLWPIGHPFWLAHCWREGRGYAHARDALWEFVASLRLPYYFWLGLRGFVGSFVWIAVPVTLLAVGRRVPALGLVGWLLLVWVLTMLPFLQCRFAVENRLGALFEGRVAQRLFVRAPWAFTASIAGALTFAFPLYLLKIEMIPREAAWLPSLVFIAFSYPARLLAGYSCAFALASKTPAHWAYRWSARPILYLVAALYALVVYFSQFIAWGGIWSLYEQHAFLLPVPFFKM